MIQLRRYNYGEIKEELQQLRKRAYTADGKINSDYPAEQFFDIWDDRSTVIAALVGDQIVGSVRVVPNVSIEEIRYVHGFEGNIPVDIKCELGEASRLCVDPSQRGQGLFWELAAEMVLTARDLNISNLFGAATENLCRNWFECGFTDLGVKYPFSSLNNSLHRLLLMSVPSAVTGNLISDRFRQVLSRRSNTIQQNMKRCTANG